MRHGSLARPLILTILVAVDDPVAKLKPFAQQLKMNYPVLVGVDRDDVKDAFGRPPGYPTSFTIGRDGKIRSQHTGFVPKEEFEREIKALLLLKLMNRLWTYNKARPVCRKCPVSE